MNWNNLSLREKVELALEERFFEFCAVHNELDFDDPESVRRCDEAKAALRTEMRYSEAMNVMNELYQTIKSYFEFSR